MSERLFQATKREEYCPLCQSPLQIKQGKKGLFLGCSAYPTCDYLKPLQPHSESKIIKFLGQHCPQCAHELVLKQGHFGMFIGCSHYPNCDFIVQDQMDSEQRYPCPECQKGQLVARRGRQGKSFYACNQFPHCKFTLPTEPHLQPCPQCQGQLSLLKKAQETHRTFQCVNKHCRHIFTLECNLMESK